MTLEDFRPRYRVQIILKWPRVFDSLAAAIAYIRGRDPHWYILEQLGDDGKWTTIVSLDSSKQRADFFYLEGPDYDELR